MLASAYLCWLAIGTSVSPAVLGNSNGIAEGQFTGSQAQETNDSLGQGLTDNSMGQVQPTTSLCGLQANTGFDITSGLYNQDSKGML